MDTMSQLELAQFALMRACIELELVDDPPAECEPRDYVARRAFVRQSTLRDVRAALDAINGR